MKAFGKETVRNSERKRAGMKWCGLAAFASTNFPLFLLSLSAPASLSIEQVTFLPTLQSICLTVCFYQHPIQDLLLSTVLFHQEPSAWPLNVLEVKDTSCNTDLQLQSSSVAVHCCFLSLLDSDWSSFFKIISTEHLGYQLLPVKLVPAPSPLDVKDTLRFITFTFHS